MRVVVTGSSGCLAAVLLPALCADPGIERVTGIDRRPARFSHRKFHSVRMDIAQSVDTAHFTGHDALVHMAFVVLRGRMSEARMRRINVAGSLAVFAAAAAAGIERLILLSSASVYGSGSDMDETTQLNPLQGFCYAMHKAALDDEVARRYPHCLRLRPHVILGAHAQPLLHFLLKLPVFLATRDVEPRLQCVHELDVVAAIAAGLRSHLGGALNLAAPDTFTYGEVTRRLHRRAYALPVGLARFGLSLAWRLSGWGGEPRWLDALGRPLTLDCRRAAHELGWVPRHTAAQALSEAAR